MDGAEIDGGRSQGADPPADNMAHLLQEVGSRHNGIHPFLGMSGMGRFPFDNHLDPVGAGH